MAALDLTEEEVLMVLVALTEWGKWMDSKTAPDLRQKIVEQAFHKETNVKGTL